MEQMVCEFGVNSQVDVIDEIFLVPEEVTLDDFPNHIPSDRRKQNEYA